MKISWFSGEFLKDLEGFFWDIFREFWGCFGVFGGFLKDLDDFLKSFLLDFSTDFQGFLLEYPGRLKDLLEILGSCSKFGFRFTISD